MFELVWFHEGRFYSFALARDIAHLVQPITHILSGVREEYLEEFYVVHLQREEVVGSMSMLAFCRANGIPTATDE